MTPATKGIFLPRLICLLVIVQAVDMDGSSRERSLERKMKADTYYYVTSALDCSFKVQDF